MGLDMYLNKNKKEAIYWRKSNHIHGWMVKHVQNGEDDGGTYPVSIEKLSELLKTIESALQVFDFAERKEGKVHYSTKYHEGKEEKVYMDGYVWEGLDTKMLESILPTTEGFFFGSTEYDDQYHSDLVMTKDQLEDLIRNHTPVDVYEYWAWW